MQDSLQEHFCTRFLHCTSRPLTRTPNGNGVGPWQGAGVEELLKAFDAVGLEHERMEAEKFNEDATYKAGIIQVRLV